LYTTPKESTHAPLKEFVLASHYRDFISKATKKSGRFPKKFFRDDFQKWIVHPNAQSSLCPCLYKVNFTLGLLTGLLSGSIDSDGDSAISQWPPSSHGWSIGSESFFVMESNSTTMISRNSTYIVDFMQVEVIIWWAVKSTGVIKDEHHCQDGNLVRGDTRQRRCARQRRRCCVVMHNQWNRKGLLRRFYVELVGLSLGSVRTQK
jgi:hypothetical protein